MDWREIPAKRIDRRHPWEQARAVLVHRLLADAALLFAGQRVLDVGAGDAWLAGTLAAACPGLDIVAWEPNCGPGTALPWPGVRPVRAAPDGTFPLILMLDVAEHVRDDRAFVAAVVAHHLAPGGWLLFSAPAWPALFSHHDRWLGHHRRYTPRAARELLAAAGLRVVHSGGAFHSLLPVRAVQRLWSPADDRPPSHAGNWAGGRTLTAALTYLLRGDAAISLLAARCGIGLPGLSYWALCRAPTC